MDFLSLTTQITLSLLLLLFPLVIKTILSHFKSTSNSVATPPQPPGAWPLIGHLHLLDGPIPVARILGAMADSHGPVFSLRLGSHHGVVVSSWEAMKECFTTNDRVFASRPSMAVTKYLGYDGASFGISPYGPYWRDVRKMVTVDLLTARRLDDFGHVRVEEIDGFVENLYSMSGGSRTEEAVALSGRIELLTFNIIVRMLAGKRFSFSKESHDKNGGFQEAIKKVLYLGGVFVFSDAVPALEWLDIGGYIKSMKQTFKEVDNVLEGWVQERIHTRKQNNDQSVSDFMDVMLKSIEENEMVDGYTRETVIKATILMLIMTGSESTSETIIWAISLLLSNPRTLKLAQDEIDKIVGRDRFVQESDIQNLPYLQAIYKETLRLYPPGPLSGPREALEDCRIGKYHIPKGTRLVANLWKLHRDPNVWSDPDEFRPERFLNEKSEVHFKGQCFEFIPFSSGRRMCPGMTFGLQVIHLTLARLLQSFDLSMPDGEKVDMSEGLGIALPKLKPLDVVITPRLSQKLYQSI
ncbi:dimethylnonatriene synthase-like [Salvia divinorum]|uniref:Flavonoid-6-hydroxylase n=1 Tax=Salvia divinorum TaxID=28513 RepID=A0ABD1II00_SALDI